MRIEHIKHSSILRRVVSRFHSERIVGGARQAVDSRRQIARQRAHIVENLLRSPVAFGIVVAQCDGKRQAAVDYGLERAVEARLGGSAIYYVAGDNHQVRTLGIERIGNILGGNLRVGITRTPMHVGELHNLKLALGIKPQLSTQRHSHHYNRKKHNKAHHKSVHISIIL